MIITTTEHIEGKKVIEYLGPISTNIVVGTGFVSDFFASASDIFGGRSETYINQMDSLYSRLMQELKGKAELSGADALIGLKIDFDEISGKGMQMFMANAYATGVKTIDEEYYEEYIRIKKEYYTDDSQQKLVDMRRQIKEKVIEQQKRLEIERKLEASKQEVRLQMEEQRQQLGTATRTGNVCNKCGYDELTSFDKACPKCKRQFVEKSNGRDY